MFGNQDDDEDQDIWGSIFGKKKTSSNPLSNAFGGKQEGSFPNLMGIYKTRIIIIITHVET